MTLNQSELAEGAVKGVLAWLYEQVSNMFFYLLTKSKYRNKNSRIGIVIAIDTLTESDFEKLQLSFIGPIEQKTAGLSLNERANVIVLDRKDARKIRNREDALKHLNKNRCHIIIYGNVTIGKHEGKNQYVFRLDGVVKHSLVRKNISNYFSHQFRTILPEVSFFPESEDILNFQFASEHLSYVIGYVVAFAATISGELKLSRKLLEDLVNRLKSVENIETIHPLDRLKTFCEQTLFDVLLIELQFANEKFLKSREPQDVLNMKKELGILKQLRPRNYRVNLFQSVFFFFDGRIDAAIAELKEIRNPDPVWRYSLAFLYAFKGENDKALELYKKTNHKPVDGAILIDIEIFISETINKHPEKVQLIFFRGLLNYKQKGDFVLAKNDFEFFLSKEESGKFPELTELAQKYLDQQEYNFKIGLVETTTA